MRNIEPKGKWSSQLRKRTLWRWNSKAREEARERALAWHAANPYSAMSNPPGDPQKGLGYLDRGVDVPRSFARSVARARDKSRKVL